MSDKSLIDARQVFMIDINLGNTEFYHQDLYISTSDAPFDIISLIQCMLDFVLKNEGGIAEVLETKDEFKNPCTRIVLENWVKNAKLYCNIYNVEEFPATVKEDFANYLDISDITPKKEAISLFKEFLSDGDLEDDQSQLEAITISSVFGKTNYKLKQTLKITELAHKLMDHAFQHNASLFFKVATYPVFEIHYPTVQVVQIWPNVDSSSTYDSYSHEFMEL